MSAAPPFHLVLVEPLGFRLDDKTLARAGIDYWPQVTWRTWPSFDALREANTTGRFYFLTTKAARPYTAARFQPGDFLVFGRETRGLPESLLTANTETCLTIPIANAQVRSLNLATAAAIVLFEALRQVDRLR